MSNRLVYPINLELSEKILLLTQIISFSGFSVFNKLFRIKSWEHSGKLWQKLFRVKKWKSRIIEGTSIAKQSYDKSHPHGRGGKDLIVYALIANVPFIIVQRYNRGRIEVIFSKR